MPQAEVEKLLAQGYNSGVSIRGRVPVHTTYFTTTADADGKLQSFADIYSLDAGVAAAALGRQAKPEAVADNAETKTEAKPKPKQAKPSTVGSAAPPQASGFTSAIP
jgi:hypothetical protein